MRCSATALQLDFGVCKGWIIHYIYIYYNIYKYRLIFKGVDGWKMNCSAVAVRRERQQILKTENKPRKTDDNIRKPQ